MNIQQRIEWFWERVTKTDGCWLWTGHTNKSGGYGQLNVSGKKMSAHRFAWLIQHGPIPDGLMVLHHCDTPLCIRGSHLFLGTAKDNSLDMAQKGRASKAMLGHKHDEATRVKMRAAWTPERKEMLVASRPNRACMLGRKHSAETRAKMSASARARFEN